MIRKMIGRLPLLMGAFALASAAHAHATPVGDISGPWSGPAGDRNPQAMWVDISDFATGTAQEAGVFGQSVCESLAQGNSEGTIAAALVGTNTSVSDARYLVHAAEWHYCPSRY